MTMAHKQGYKLDPMAVRTRASSIPGCRELGFSNACASFLVGLDTGRADDIARVNCYCDTGTIGTSRVLGGKIRQCFRRNVGSLDVVERLLKNPERLLTIDEGLIGLTDDESRQEHRQEHPTSPKSLKKELELADVGLCILKGEREKLVRHLESFADQNQKADVRDDEAVDSSDSSSISGMEFRFSLPADVMAQVDQCLRDITKMDKLIKGVATNGKGTVFLYGNGGVAYTPSIPRALYQKLRQLRNSTFSARPSYISLGTRDRYFVAFNDGTFDWKGPKALDKCLKKCMNSAQQPRSVSFGSTYDTFFVVFSDGSWQYQGRGIPPSLESALASRDAAADLTTLNLGPSGEWFLKAKNGQMLYSNLSDHLSDELDNILNNSNNYLHFLDFGEHGSYFISYD